MVQVGCRVPRGHDDRDALAAGVIEDLVEQAHQPPVARLGERTAQAHVDHVCPPVGGVDHAVENRAEGAVVDVAADLHGHERRPRRDSSRAHRVAAHGCSGVRAVEEQIGVDLFAGEVLLNRIGLGERHRAAVRELRVERPQQVHRTRRIHPALGVRVVRVDP